MQTALHQLGLHNCYHMSAVISNLPLDADLWTKALEAKYAGKGDKWTREDWDRLLGESQACVDLPSALFTLELAEAYPEAKIVVLNRDPEKWYDSVCETVYKAMQPDSLLGNLLSIYCAVLDDNHRAFIRLLTAMRKYAMPYDHGKEKEKAIEWFHKRYQDVRDAIPAHRRLEFSVKDGFRPLCEYLGVPVPMIKDGKTGEMVEAPFPHVNDRASFVENMDTRNSTALSRANGQLFTYVSKAFTLGVLSYGGYYAWGKYLAGRL